MPRRLLLCCALLLATLLGCRERMLPDVPVPPSDPSKEWEAVLAEVVDDAGYVDYALLEQRRAVLERYVAWLSGPRLWARNDPGERHAPYLNAYNALVLYQVLERGRPGSVLEVDGWFPKAGSGFFFETAFKLGPDWLSLAEIRHERVRLAEMDYHSHAAMACPFVSCPPLRDELYEARGGYLGHQLRRQMTRWVDDDARGVRIEGGVAVFNPIFDEYARDFDFWTASLDLCSLTARYATGDKRAALAELADRGCPHRFFEFDWRLNSVENAPR